MATMLMQIPLQFAGNLSTESVWNVVTSASKDDDDVPPIFDPRHQTQTLFKVQLYVCTTIGALLFLMFCYLRYKFPLFYSIRSYKNKKIKKLPSDMFSWIRILISINNDQLLQVVGLESYVFLCFFRMSIKILLSLSVLGFCILSPVRYFMTGSFDRDSDKMKSFSNFFFSVSTGDGDDGSDPDNNSEPTLYLAICMVFTYIFTALIFYFLFKETNHIIKIRQRFLGSQRSLTDRTIVIKNIPKNMRREEDLKAHIEELKLGKVDQINFVYDYSPLVKLMEQRDEVVCKLEVLYSQSCGIDTDLQHPSTKPRVNLEYIDTKTPPSIDSIIYNQKFLSSESAVSSEDGKYSILATSNDKHFGEKRRSCTGIDKSQKEKIDTLSRELIKINDQIDYLRQTYHFKRLPIAFITMDSVTDAQMAAQAVFSPKVFELITELAPAPLDVLWNNLIIDTKSLFLRKNVIEVIIILFSCLLIIPIRYITSLLNVTSIRKIWKEFGDYLIKHDKVRTVVTGLLPTYLFSIINSVLPYVISLLSNLQGLGSKGDVELSVMKKNFLYVFFNLFLVFTLFGTLSSYKALLSDTTKIAPLLATSIQSLSLFYIDLIILQGITMFPFKLLQIGDMVFLFWDMVVRFSKRTPRMYRESLYKPSLFDLGLILPQHILIFIITILYSSISTKILIAGLVYFIMGFYTYKYQLVYSLVHPYHSTGKSWPVIFKRVCLGVFFLHLQVFGSFALEQSFVLAGFMLPLFPSTIIALMFFERNYQPLLHYIALDAIKTCGKSVESDAVDNPLDELLSGISPENNVGRKNSIASFRGLLDGYEDCDAVILNNSIENVNHIEEEVIADTLDPEDQLIQDNTTGTSPTAHSNPNSGSEAESHAQPYDLSATSRMSVGNPKMLRRCSTIEEEREMSQSYVHPCLLDKFEGLMIGWEGDDIDFLKHRIVNSSGNELDYGDIVGAGVRISSDDGNDDEEGTIGGDIEQAPGYVVGNVIRVEADDEIW
jgi:hypothetical protein